MTEDRQSPPTDDEFYGALVREVQRARSKFPNNSHLLLALVEEVGELSKALMEHERFLSSPKAVFEEAVQVAAMALRLAVEGDPSFLRYLQK